MVMKNPERTDFKQLYAIKGSDNRDALLGHHDELPVLQVNEVGVIRAYPALMLALTDILKLLYSQAEEITSDRIAQAAEAAVTVPY